MLLAPASRVHRHLNIIYFVRNYYFKKLKLVKCICLENNHDTQDDV